MAAFSHRSVLLPAAAAQRLKTELVASGFQEPLFVTAAPGDTARLFVLEQNTARIRIVRGGAILPAPFLDVGALASSGGERGLLGLAFHPQYASNGWFFINYTDNAGDTVVARYSVSADPDVADPGSAVVVLTIDQPFSNHNGGMLAFGPNDGYLYIGMGDGGSAGDPGNRAQNPGQLLGKLLRIDVDSLPYTVPAGNPFVGPGDPLDEIWALGVRNPWRFSFDRETGDLWTGDVGQDRYEEIDFQPGASAGGENYGWRLMEGLHCYNPPANCNPGNLVLPIHEYTHGGFPNFRCSITGGYVYRGESIPGLQGTYFFADYCSGQIWSFRYDGVAMSEFTERTAELAPSVGSISSITSFGEDARGELYICDFSGGELWRIAGDLMDLQASPLVAGQSATIGVRGATPGGMVYFVYSLAGPGLTRVSSLGVTLGVASPVLIGGAMANGQGVAALSRQVPLAAQGVMVWIQALESGNTSDLEVQTVQ